MEIEPSPVEKPVSITNRGMLTIPATMRKRLGLADGDKVVLIEDEGTLRIIPVVPIEQLRAQSCSAREMIQVIEKCKAEEMELENR